VHRRVFLLHRRVFLLLPSRVLTTFVPQPINTSNLH
jgi:hypothetical protein